MYREHFQDDVFNEKGWNYILEVRDCNRLFFSQNDSLHSDIYRRMYVYCNPNLCVFFLKRVVEDLLILKAKT